MKSLSQHMLESLGSDRQDENVDENSEKVNETKITSAKEFEEYAETVLKEQHGEDYDESKAKETIKGILDEAGDDYGKAVGMLTSK